MRVRKQEGGGETLAKVYTVAFMRLGKCLNRFGMAGLDNFRGLWGAGLPLVVCCLDLRRFGPEEYGLLECSKSQRGVV